MSDAKFCDGELKVSDNSYYLDVSDVDSDGLYIGQACIGVAYSESRYAHLFAAAPEMYAMLDLAISYMDGDAVEDFTYSYQDIKKLLAKARGEV